MKRFVRKTRLVLACMNLLGGLFRLLGALVDMASNYSPRRDPEVGVAPISPDTRTSLIGLRVAGTFSARAF